MEVISPEMNTAKTVVKIRPEKKFRTVKDLNPQPLQNQSNAPLTELTSQQGAGQYIGSK